MNNIKAIVVIMLVLTSGTCAPSSVFSDRLAASCEGMKVTNPDQLLNDYLIFTGANGIPLTLKTNAGDRTLLKTIIAKQVVDPSRLVRLGKAIDFCNARESGSESLADDAFVCRLNGLLCGQDEPSAFRDKNMIINRFSLTLNQQMLNLLNALSKRDLFDKYAAYPMTKLSRFERKKVGEGRELYRGLTEIIAAFNGADGFEKMQLLKEIVTKFARERGRSGFSLPEMKSAIAEKDEALANHLFDTDLSGHEEISAGLAELYRVMNQAFMFKADGESFELAFDLAARVYMTFVKIHPFLDGNGRTARFLANMVLVRAGLLPVFATAVEWNVAVREGLSDYRVLASHMIKWQLRGQNMWERFPRISPLGIMTGGGKPVVAYYTELQREAESRPARK